MDFFYLTTKEEAEERLTSVCLVDCSSGAAAATVLPGKGGAEGGYALKFLLHHLRRLGLPVVFALLNRLLVSVNHLFVYHRESTLPATSRAK